MGVKSLWKLLTPVGRPVMLETMEGKAMAIDSSIWIYQFQATMRDNDGRALSNAHVLGFLRRICKLLFYGIKPVFVFDGGAPVLKRTTLNERRKKKSGAAASHAKLAEKLLAAQMRREALKHAKGSQVGRSSKGKGKAPSGPVVLDENTVYLEDIDPSAPKTPVRPKRVEPSSTSSKKNKPHDHDPYHLPEVDLEEAVAKATRSNVPDPRLATEEELRTFIEDMRPEDFDVTSPAFRELPTEVQYEIVGDLRLKSRQTSYARLQNMLRNAPTPLDFSKQQIKNLRQRNTLTQQLLMTTDTIGKANISIPVRIASERNKEYVLMKNDGEAGGWILGIRDDGTQQKPIVIDHDNEKAPEDLEEDSDEDMEEVEISGAASHDPDLRDYRRQTALSALANRYTPTKLAPLTTKPVQRKIRSKPLFDLGVPDRSENAIAGGSDNSDEELAFAIQASLDQGRSTKESAPAIRPRSPLSNAIASSSKLVADPKRIASPEIVLEEDYMFASPTRLETALSIANAGPSPIATARFRRDSATASMFGRPVLLNRPAAQIPPTEFVQEGPPKRLAATQETHLNFEDVFPSSPRPEIATDSEEDMDEVVPIAIPSSVHSGPSGDPDAPNEELQDVALPSQRASPDSHEPEPGPSQPMTPSRPPSVAPDVNDDDMLTQWSRSPSPLAGPSDLTSRPSSPIAETWDAAQEMDADVEEGEFARFMSQVKGKDLDDVRREIEDEIQTLNRQKKTAMRDSEDITQQMISQIMMMLRLFGIPYITAPMEAEAQCAELVSLGLVDGVITDDSDVFLFGGQRVFKNMFNQSKTVECFLLSDLARELGLDRDTLVRLAYLLGSDYVDGLPGVGPVVAMELLREFPGEDGLHKFKDWWLRVQSGRDKEEDNKSTFRKRFKKKFKDLYISNDWPNAAVRDAYYHPIVDDSDEPFKWGLPDLDALREFSREELGWGQAKVDELLLPIIQKMGKRGHAGAVNKQGNLNEYFDAGSGTYAPRKRQAFASKRLQKVVSDFRKKRKNSASPAPELETEAPTRKKAKTGGRSKATAKTGSKASKGKVKRGRGSRSKSVEESDGAGPESSGEEADARRGKAEGNTPPLAVQLRPRPKPAYKGAEVASDTV